MGLFLLVPLSIKEPLKLSESYPCSSVSHQSESDHMPIPDQPLAQGNDLHESPLGLRTSPTFPRYMIARYLKQQLCQQGMTASGLVQLMVQPDTQHMTSLAILKHLSGSSNHSPRMDRTSMSQRPARRLSC